MNDHSLIMGLVFMRLLVTCCINLSMWVNSLRDGQCESILFFFLIFYDVLILFTSGFFIVVSALEEVGPWKVSIFLQGDFYGPCRVWTRPELLPDPDLSKEHWNKGIQFFFSFFFLYPIHLPTKKKVWTFLPSAFSCKAHQISSLCFYSNRNHSVIG